jgi:hypothetical protein
MQADCDWKRQLSARLECTHQRYAATRETEKWAKVVKFSGAKPDRPAW